MPPANRRARRRRTAGGGSRSRSSRAPGRSRPARRTIADRRWSCRAWKAMSSTRLMLRHEHLVAEAELRDRRVIRQRDARHGRSLGADEHAAVRHRRPPVIAEAEIDLHVLVAEAQDRAARHRFIRICNAAELQQHVVGGLEVSDDRSGPARPLPTCPDCSAACGPNPPSLPPRRRRESPHSDPCTRSDTCARAAQSASSTSHAAGSASRTIAAGMGRRTIGRPAYSNTCSI